MDESLIELRVHRLAYKENALYFIRGRLLTHNPFSAKWTGETYVGFLAVRLVSSSTDNSTAPVSAFSALIICMMTTQVGGCAHEAPCSLVRLPAVVHGSFHLACQIPSFILHISHVMLADTSNSAAQSATKYNLELEFLRPKSRAS